MKKNILMITSDYIPAYGGIGVHVDALCKSLLELDCRIYLLVARLKTSESYKFESKDKYIVNEVSEKFTIIEMNPDFNQELSNMQEKYLDRLEEKENFDYLCYRLNNTVFNYALEYLETIDIKMDVIHVHDAFLGAGVVWLAQLLQLPLVTTMHSTSSGKEWLIDNIRRYLANNSDYVICVSDFIKQEVEKRYKPTCKVSTIHNSIHLDASKKVKRQILNESNEIEIVYCGRLTAIKGIDILLKALPGIIQNSKDRHIHLSIIGEGEERGYLESLSHKLGIENNVTFKGYMPNECVREVFRNAYCVALPSRKEAFSTVALEAMDEGALVIASKVGGFEEMIIDGINGLLFKPEEVKALEKCIQSAIDTPNQSLKDNAINTVKEKFSWQKNSLKFLEIYTNLIK